MTSRIMRKPTIANITKLTSSTTSTLTTRLLFAVLFLTLILPLLMVPRHNQPGDNNNADFLVSAFTSTRTTKSHKFSSIRQPHSSSARHTLKLFVVKDENQQQQQQQQQKQQQPQRQVKNQQQQELRRSNEQEQNEAKVEKVEIKEEAVDDIQSLRLEIRMWSQIKAPHGPKEAEKVLRKMIQLYSGNSDSDSDSDSSDNVNEQQQEKNAAPNNREMVQDGQDGQGQQQRNNNNNNSNTSNQNRNTIKKNSYSRPYVDVIDCNQVINAYSKSRNDENAPQYALQILKDMITLSSSNKKSKSSSSNSNLVPNVVTFNSVINGYAQKGNFLGASRVFQLQIHDYKQNQNSNAKPNVRSFNTMINACSKHITLNARSHKSTYNKSKNNNNNKDFSSGSGETNNNNNNNNNNSMPEIAEKLLATLQEWYTMGEIENGADTITYSAVINCWSKSDTTDGPQRALDLLNKMIHQNIAPNTITYNSVIDAYARQGNILGANNVFQMMQLQSTKNNNRGGDNNSNSNCRPNVRSYNILIDAWSKSINNNNNSNNNNNDCDNAPEEAESLLKEMILLHSKGELEDFPDTITYNGVINCWGKSKNNSIQSAKHCLDILKKMILKYESDTIKYKRLRPDTITYTAVLNAHARRGDIVGAKLVWEMMKDDYLNNGNRMAKPNVQSFNTLIDTYSKSISSSQNYDSLEATIDAPDEAESLLNDMIDLYSRGELKGNGPDIYSYNGVINCWSKSNQPNSPQRALQILQSMRKNKNNNSKTVIKPDTITYNSVLDAYARHGDVVGANKVWETMKEDGSYTAAKPNVRTYSILIDAWSKSASASGTDMTATNTTAADRIIIDEVERLFIELNIRYDNGDLGEEGGPNEITYTSMIQCLDQFHGTEKRVEELKTLRNNIKK